MTARALSPWETATLAIDLVQLANGVVREGEEARVKLARVAIHAAERLHRRHGDRDWRHCENEECEQFRAELLYAMAGAPEAPAEECIQGKN